MRSVDGAQVDILQIHESQYFASPLSILIHFSCSTFKRHPWQGIWTFAVPWFWGSDESCDCRCMLDQKQTILLCKLPISQRTMVSLLVSLVRLSVCLSGAKLADWPQSALWKSSCKLFSDIRKYGAKDWSRNKFLLSSSKHYDVKATDTSLIWFL